MFSLEWIGVVVALALVCVLLVSATAVYARYCQSAKHDKAMSKVGWVVSASLLIILLLLIGYSAVTFGQYRLRVNHGERLIAEIQPGTSEELLVAFLNTNQELLGISGWKSTEEKYLDRTDDAYLYHVWFNGRTNLWSLIGQKLYLSIKIDGVKKEVKSIHWGFQ